MTVNTKTEDQIRWSFYQSSTWICDFHFYQMLSLLNCAFWLHDRICELLNVIVIKTTEINKPFFSWTFWFTFVIKIFYFFQHLVIFLSLLKASCESRWIFGHKTVTVECSQEVAVWAQLSWYSVNLCCKRGQRVLKRCFRKIPPSEMSK